MLEQLGNSKEEDNLGDKKNKQKILSDKGTSFVYSAIKVYNTINTGIFYFDFELHF